jgi:hypothetical protein
MNPQVSYGDADHDPWKHTDEELAYLYGRLPAKHLLPTVRKCPLCGQDSNNHYLACSETWFGV